MLSRTMNNQELLDRIEKQCRKFLRILLALVWVVLRVFGVSPVRRSIHEEK